MPSFNDDEEPLRKPGPPPPRAPLAPNDQKVVLDLKGASAAASRAPLDLVTVIDVSGSMDSQGRLDSAKKALRFIIRKLTDDDRLSIVKFDHVATRICPLRCATEAAKVDLEALVGRLVTRGATNIQAGLDTGLSVLSQRKFNAGRAANVMLMSDGEQNAGDAMKVDPGDVPVHTFRKSLGGVYNFMDDCNKPTLLSETFSQILAGLVTIVAQDLELTVTPFMDEATIKAAEAGTYRRSAATDGSASVAIQFGTLYSTEERKVVVELALRDHSSFRPYNADVAKVQYRFSFEGQQFVSNNELITIRRSERAPAGTAGAPPPQVQAEVVRLKHADSIKAAMDKAEGDKLEDARNILAEALKALERLVVDPMVDMLRKELQKLMELFKGKEIYQRQGRPAAISSLASHDRQRFTARGDAEDIRIFATQRMDTYLEQAKQDDNKPIPTAADDIMEELEPEPEAVPRMEPVQQDVPAAPKPKAREGRTLSLGLRAVTAVLSLVAFSIMLSAMTSAWDGDGYVSPPRIATA
ncbi:uncharacterized protein [Miscanthus floridulus]|uniref:uncharacterized protein n=1 Tax=Miscanthus floridulus TaxID=154761 RepID=UPI00345B41B3